MRKKNAFYALKHRAANGQIEMMKVEIAKLKEELSAKEGTIIDSVKYIFSIVGWFSEKVDTDFMSIC